VSLGMHLALRKKRKAAALIPSASEAPSTPEESSAE